MEGALAEQLKLLPDYLGRHMLLTLCALGLGLAISIPLGVLAVRVRALQAPLLGLSSIIQTIPGLALLALMVPLLSQIGFVPALIALTLYSLLPVLRNTVTGLSGVDPQLIEAAQGVGMSESQIMQRVRFPLALPVIIAGIRIAAVWTVGMATLSTPVGATSLGNYIFSGLQTQNTTAILVGCAAAALLALVLDGLVRLMEFSVERRNSALQFAACGGIALLAIASLYPLYGKAQQSSGGPRVIIGAKPFTEQRILAQTLANSLRAAGFETEIKDSLGSNVAFDALCQGSIDCYVDYSGTIWATYMQRSDMPARESMNEQIDAWLESQKKVQDLGTLGFANNYALAMRRTHAENLGVSSIGDLVRHAPRLKMAGDYEWFQRPEWASVRDTYRLDFAEEITLDPTLMYTAINEGQVDVIPAYSTEGRIASYDLLVLNDPSAALPPYDAMLLLSASASQNATLVEALTPLLGTIDEVEMREANKLVDLDGASVDEAAELLDAAAANGS